MKHSAGDGVLGASMVVRRTDSEAGKAFKRPPPLARAQIWESSMCRVSSMLTTKRINTFANVRALVRESSHRAGSIGVRLIVIDLDPGTTPILQSPFNS